MRLPAPSGPPQRQSQAIAGIGLVILTFSTAFAVSQALPQIRNDNGADHLTERGTGVQARQLQGAPWRLPWGIFDGGQSASPVNLAQPATTTPLPAAVPAVPNNQPQGPLGGVVQIIPGVLASSIAAIGGTTPGNVLPAAPNAVPTGLQPGSSPSLPTAVPNGQAGQSPNSGGLLNPVQSLINTIVGVGGSAGSPLSLSGVTGVLNPLATPLIAGIPSQVNAAISNGVPVIGSLPTITGLSAAVGVVTAAPGIPHSISPILNVVPGSLIMSSLQGVLASVSAILPASTPLVDLGGLNAPQLPADLADTVPSLIGSLINALTQNAAPVSTIAGAPNQAPISPTSAVYFPCTMIELASGTTNFILTTCSTGVAVAGPQTTASTVSGPVAAPALSATVGSASSIAFPGVPSASSILSAGGGTANLPASSQVSPFITSGSSLAGTSQPSSAAPPTGGLDNGSPVSASSAQPGAGSQGNSAQPQNPNSTGQPQPPTPSSNVASSLTPVMNTPAGTAQSSSQPNGGGATAPTPRTPAVSLQTTITIAAGPAASQPSAAPSGSNNSPSSSSTPSGGSIFDVDDGQGASSGGSPQRGTPVIPISDCPAVVQCPACPASPAKPPSGSCPCPGRGYSCSECLNGWFCPPQETPMQPAPCGMGWPCYHCKGGWYCAPDGNGMAPAGSNNPPAVVITTVTAFVLPQPTGPGNGAPNGDGSGNGNGGSGNGSGGSGNGPGDGGAGNNGGSPGNGVPNSVGSGNAASSPCTTPSNTQPTSATGSGGGNGNNNGSGSGTPNGPGNAGSVSTLPGNGSSPTPSPTSPNTGSGSSSGNGSDNGQGGPGSGSPSSGYGTSSPALPAPGTPNNGSGTGPGAPNGNGTPGSSGPATPAAGGNGGTGSGGPNAGSGGGSPSNVTPKAAAEVSGWTHLGCFKDSPIRTLDCDPSNYFAGSMSNEKCISHCASQGFKLAGTEYGKECWCGNAFQLAERVPQEQCNEVCDGRSTDICGGDWAVTVYSASGQALNVPSDDDTGNNAGNSAADGPGSGNTAGSGSSSPPSPAGPLAPSTAPPQTLPQGQPSPAPAGTPQPAPPPSASSSQPPQLQIDLASLIKSIINAFPKGSLDGGYGSGLGARDSGASDSDGSRAPGNAGVPNAGAGGAPMMGPGPVAPTDGLGGYASKKRDVAGRSVKRSSIIGRRAAAKADGVGCIGDADGHDVDCVAEKA